MKDSNNETEKKISPEEYIKKERDFFENECNTLTNIILDIKKKYPKLKILTIKETEKKHGKLK